MFQNALSQHVAIVLPSTKELDKPLSPEEHDKEFHALKEFLTRRFGGVTIIPSVGGYLSETTNAVVAETTHVFISFVGELTDKDVEAVLSYAKGIKNRLSQESVSVLVNGGLLFVK